MARVDRVAILADGVSHVREVPEGSTPEAVIEGFWVERAARRAAPTILDPEPPNEAA